MGSNNTIIEDGWPEGYQFTVSFKVVTPGVMSEFLQAMLTEAVMHGCTVERVDLQDRFLDHDDDIIRLKDALETANKILSNHGLMGVIPNTGGYDDEEILATTDTP